MTLIEDVERRSGLLEEAAIAHRRISLGCQIVINRSESYRGGLIVVAVPRGSQWPLTLSDIPNPRLANTTKATARQAAAMAGGA
jgi:hypothetical protein